MASLVPIPLGQRIPSSLHAVSCSLPTMRAVRGYEEKDPEITRHLTSGYPRFVVHPLLHELAGHLAAAQGLAGQTLWLTSSPRTAQALADQLKDVAGLTLLDPAVPGVAHPADANVAGRAKVFLQNVGGFMSSRCAEDHLVRLGHRTAAAPEPLYYGDPLAEIHRVLRPVFPACGPADLHLTPCGMSAIHAVFQAAAAQQAARGRTIWVQLGWLYLDSIAILKRFTATPQDYVHLPDVFDHAALERLFAAHGSRIAGILTELPTNPLVQTPDVPRLAELARRHGAMVILDPSVNSIFNLDVLPHADAVVASLTKYTASEGDLTAGLVAVNPASPHAADLRRDLPPRLDPLYPRDLARLAFQIGGSAAVMAKINASTPRVVDFLSAQPAVNEIYWALRGDSCGNYYRLARGPQAVGGMISFTLRIPLEKFYDRLRLAKGPSFGMKTTLISPFMYLAHYDLVTTPAGRAELAASGIDPDLLRLCIGTEPVEEIIAALAEALR
jgi:cystathionine gamma-synthase